MNNKNRMRNRIIKERCGNERSMEERVVWTYENDGWRKTRQQYIQTYSPGVDAPRGKGRLKMRNNEGVKELVEQRGLSFQESKKRATKRNKWKGIEYGGK